MTLIGVLKMLEWHDLTELGYRKCPVCGGMEPGEYENEKLEAYMNTIEHRKRYPEFDDWWDYRREGWQHIKGHKSSCELYRSLYRSLDENLP